MGDCQFSTISDDAQCGDDVECLRDQLERARAGERRAQTLLESVASLMGQPDETVVMERIAENAVRHVGLPRVSVYRIDHDEGLLNEVARVEADVDDSAMALPGMTPVAQLEVEHEPVQMRPGNQLAEFASGDRAWQVVECDDGEQGLSERLMVQMQTQRLSGVGQRGVMVGVIVASCPEPPTSQLVGLMRSLATMGASAVEAARMEEFRSQLVSAVSHELRTPLAAIRAYNELLLDEDAGEINDEQRLFLERIETTCLNLDRMVEDLLDLSRLRAGEMVIQRSPVDVVSVIEHIIDTLSSEARKRDVSLAEEILTDLPVISSNPDRLAQVLFNLVGNAVKYVDEGGSVLVRAGLVDAKRCKRLEGIGDETEKGEILTDDRCMLIEVIDDGPGIAADELDCVFDEFYRGRLTERTTKGSGLGLAIASRLTRLLGGLLQVDSTPGEGTTFWLVFPVEDTGEGERQ
ncbi:MAG: hypothetical protein GF393_06405 [Armatimonadia bacterium]|nr:hypothetical protein [Armatimonadia bacterium]